GVDLDGLEALVDGEHDRQADGGLGGGQHDHEDGEDLSVVGAAVVASEGHVIEIGRIEYQLDAHQDADGVAPREHAEEPEAEGDPRQHQEVLEGTLGHYRRPSLRDTTSAPISATSSTSEAISKGST